MAKRAMVSRGIALLDANSYGKSRVRLVKVTRIGRRRTVRELSIDIALTGDFTDIHICGDNRACLPTDTMKNTVYALAKDHAIDVIEVFAVLLATHFVNRNKQVSGARVRITETRWDRLVMRRREHRHCFVKGTEERQGCSATVQRTGVGKRSITTIDADLHGLTLLKSADSGFRGFPKDEYTTLAETDDRILTTQITATWVYGGKRTSQVDYAACREQVRQALIGTFASHKSKSVQHTLFAMGASALKACRAVARIHLSMPNKHCLLVNLSPFGLQNQNEIFMPTDEPHGLIEASIVRA